MRDREYELAIVHDYENCRLTTDCTVSQLIGRIHRSFHSLDGNYHVGPTRIYSGNPYVFTSAEHQHMQEINGFTFYPTKKTKKKCYCGNELTDGDGDHNKFDRVFDLADSVLIEQMLGRAVSGSLPHNILLITTDRDFNLALRYLKRGKYNVFQAKMPKDDGFVFINRDAVSTWSWPTLRLGGAPLPNPF